MENFRMNTEVTSTSGCFLLSAHRSRPLSPIKGISIPIGIWSVTFDENIAANYDYLSVEPIATNLNGILIETQNF